MKVKKIETTKYRGWVHNIECGPDHNYIYNGCVVHNCGAGDYFVRSLTSDEIVSQVDYSIEQTGVDSRDIEKLQIMFMSMGEPMMNYKNLAFAIVELYDKYPNARLLISTIGPRVGYGPLILLSKEIPTIGLQFSIHESTDEARDKLIPFAEKLSLQEIAEVGKRWYETTGRKPFFNYCAGDHNTTDKDVENLRKLLDPYVFECTISVICERNQGLPAKNDHQVSLAQEFSEKMLNVGYNVRVFDPAGQDDIGGGCGQLFHVQNWMKENPNKIRPSVGNGLPIIHCPNSPTCKS